MKHFAPILSRITLGFVIAASLLSSAKAESVASRMRVACVGDSITAGSGTKIGQFDSYPSQLQRMLDPAKWLVLNFGVSGATLLNQGDRPYQKQRAFAAALKSNPNVVVIMLGTNDSKPKNWPFKDKFSADYKELIDQFKALPSQPRIYVCHPPFVVGAGNYGINESVVLEEIPIIDAIAKDEKVKVIDMHAPLKGKDTLYADRVHPNTDGANLLARTVYQTLTGKEFSGTLNPVLETEWMGWRQVHFMSGNRPAYIVFPKKAAPGNPWIWRTEFSYTEPQADLALLEKGWHVAYLNVQNMYGSPAALDAMDQFYAQVVKEYDLAPKVVVEGFSRGGLYAFNWAARNPTKVASIYGDAPVLDFKSWPAGKGASKVPSPKDWQNLLAIYGLTEQQAMDYKLNPVDNLKPLAEAKIPILIVCGDSDKTVPYEENALIAEKRYQELGGEIKVIVKPGGDHHPHSLRDPKPIVDFILSHVPPAP